MTEWREGRVGALNMGLRHGAYCLGCCWMLMLLLFVGGIINIAWIAAGAAFILIEKVSPAGHWIGRVTGFLLDISAAPTLFSCLRPCLIIPTQSTTTLHLHPHI